MTSYHGWTHAPKAQGGSDPIPGLGAKVQIALAHVANFSLDNPAGFKQVDFSTLSLSAFNDGATFSLSAGDLVIERGGFYLVNFMFSGFTLTANVDTQLWARWDTLDGFWSHNVTAGSGVTGSFTVPLRIDDATSPHDVVNVGFPYPLFYALEDADAPQTITFEAFVDEDGSQVNHSPDISIYVARFGDLFGA